MRAAAIDIGSNTTRLLVAERADRGLRRLAERRAYSRIDEHAKRDGAIVAEKVDELAEVVAGQLREAAEQGARATRVVATAAIREARNGEDVAERISAACGAPIEILSGREEGRLAFLGATRTLDPAPSGELAVVDVGGGSSEIVLGATGEGARHVRSLALGSGALTRELVRDDPPSADEIAALREAVAARLAGVEVGRRPDRAVAVGGSATALAAIVGPSLGRESLERAVGLLAAGTAAELAERYELDPERVRVLAAGALILARLAAILDRPLEVGAGGLREGMVIELLERASEGPSAAPA